MSATSPVTHVSGRVLNPKLYLALVGRFGKVKISNEGQPMLTRSTLSPFTHVLTEKVVDPGEHYRVCCPYCGDKRFRLYISYKWNSCDDSGNKTNKFRIHCHNNNCNMYDFDNQLRLYMLSKAERLPAIEVNESASLENKPTSLPGLCVPINSLPVTHPAAVYIRKRRFDVNELWSTWSVHYCVKAPSDSEGFIPGTKIYSRLVQNRIVVPIYWDGKMIAWQARAIDDSLPKYYTMPGLHKQRILFNGDRAKTYQLGVLVEGVFDAFRVGECAVALLGKTASFAQRELVQAYWRDGACCILLDPEAKEDAEKLISSLEGVSFKYGLFRTELPPGEDPGSMDRHAMWELIYKNAQSCLAGSSG